MPLLMPILIFFSIVLAPAFSVKFNIGPLPANLLMIWIGLVWIIFVAYLFGQRLWAIFFDFLRGIDKKILLGLSLFFIAGTVSLFVNGFSREKLGQFIVLFLQ